MWLSQRWARWREALHVVQPQTVIRWHRQGFRAFWNWKSRRGRTGRPPVACEVAKLVRTMALANPLWGAPRIHGELLKLGLDVSQRTVGRLMPRRSKPPSQNWRTFLQNNLADLVSVDFFSVPTVTFRVLYVFVVLLHHRRKVVHFNVTDSATAAWTAQQIIEAFPHDSAPRFLLRDRDSIYGGEFRRRVKSIGIAQVLTTPRSPWQNPFAERVIGTIRRELLDHVIVLNEGHLRRRLHNYFRYYHGSRTHLALAKDAPGSRAVEPPAHGLGRCASSSRRTPPPLRPPRGVATVVQLRRRQRLERDPRSREGFLHWAAVHAALCCDSLSAAVLEGYGRRRRFEHSCGRRLSDPVLAKCSKTSSCCPARTGSAASEAEASSIRLEPAPPRVSTSLAIRRAPVGPTTMPSSTPSLAPPPLQTAGQRGPSIRSPAKTARSSRSCSPVSTALHGFTNRDLRAKLGRTPFPLAEESDK